MPEPSSTNNSPACDELSACRKDGPEDTPEQSSEGGKEAQAPTEKEEPAPPDSVDTGGESPVWDGEIPDPCDRRSATPPASPERQSGIANIAGATATYVQAVVVASLTAGAKGSPTVFTCKSEDQLDSQEGVSWIISASSLIVVIALMVLSTIFGRWSAPRSAGEEAAQDPEPWV